MTETSKARTGTSLLLIGLCLIVPTLTLIPLGGVWLFQNGLALYWAGAACVFTFGVYGLQRWLLRPAPTQIDVPPRDLNVGDSTPDPDWTPAENKAWASVTAMADTVKPAELTSREALIALALGTIEATARELHPEQKEPLWQFTVPEALALIEQVSGRLRAGVAGAVPLGDRLTVAQVLKLYRWRSAIDLAEKGYDLWRLVRMVNPLSAATQELREQVSKRVYAWGRDELRLRLARKFVFEIGRGAIDLYGGRLRVTGEVLAAHVSAKSQRDLSSVAGKLAEPLRIVLAGQVSAGKSSLINALLSEVKAAVDVLPATVGMTAYALERKGQPPTLLIDSAGIGGDAANLKLLMAEVADIDCVIWVANAARADREADRQALDGLRTAFASRRDRRAPPILLVLTHIDRLRPFAEWKPPYDLNDAAVPKAVSIKAAIEAASADLGFGQADVVPVCLDEELGAYNVDTVWAAIAGKLPDAQRAQLVRTLGDHAAKVDWGRIWNQTLNAGKVLTKLVKK
ncbi:MAG: GTPase family protein [Bosea sp. (in: a-proteobacteria)]